MSKKKIMKWWFQFNWYRGDLIPNQEYYVDDYDSEWNGLNTTYEDSICVYHYLTNIKVSKRYQTKYMLCCERCVRKTHSGSFKDNIFVCDRFNLKSANPFDMIGYTLEAVGLLPIGMTDDEGFKREVKRIKFEFVEAVLRWSDFINTKEFRAFDNNGNFFSNAIRFGDFVVAITRILEGYKEEHKAITEVFRNALTEEPKKSFNELMDIARNKYLG